MVLSIDELNERDERNEHDEHKQHEDHVEDGDKEHVALQQHATCESEKQVGAVNGDDEEGEQVQHE